MNGCPPRGSGFGKRKEKVCEEAGGRGAKLEKRSQHLGSYGGSHLRPLPEPRALPVYQGRCWPGLWRWPWWVVSRTLSQDCCLNPGP